MKRANWCVLMVLAMALAACSATRESPAPTSDSESSLPGVSKDAPSKAPFDVQSVVNRLHFSYQHEGDAIVGGHSTYAVRSVGSSVSFTPATYPEERPQNDPIRRRPRAILGSPLDLETVSIARGGARRAPTFTADIDADGRLVHRSDLAVERFANTAVGAEQSWTFDRAPAGSGDLELRVRASGLSYAGQTAQGLHFADGAGLGVRYGNATWVDASGVRTRVSARWDGAEIVLSVPAPLVERSTYPAVLDPVLGPETALDAPVVGPASGGQYTGAVAYSGTNYLVVWSDYRAQASSQVIGTRVNTSGTPLDLNGIVISGIGTSGYNPAVVWDGTNYLVVYEAGGSISGRRLNTSGVIVDGTPCVLSTASGSYSPTAYNNGTTTFVAWYDYRNYGSTGIDIYGTRVSGCSATDGAATGIAISRATGDQYYPRVTFGGGNWFLVWEDHRGTTADVYGERLSAATGAPVEATATNLAVSNSALNAQMRPQVASDGTNYFVVWTDDRTAANGYDAYGARVTSAGVVQDATGIDLAVDTNYQYYPSVAFNGGVYQVVWQDYRAMGMWGNRVNPTTGALLDGAGGKNYAATSTFVASPQIVVAGAGYYVIWNQQATESDGDIYGSRVTTTPSLQDAPGVLLAQSGNGESYVRVAGGTTGWLVVWLDDRAAGRAIYGERVNSAGTPLSPPMVLSTGGLYESTPSVAFNGTNFLVTWIDSRSPFGIWGTRVSAAGAILDAAGLPLYTSNGAAGSPSPTDPDVTSDGTGWFVTWQDYRTSGRSDIYGGRVSSAGLPSDGTGIVISSSINGQYKYSPRAGFGGGFYLSCWTDYRSTTTYQLYCARVSTAGALQEASGILLSGATTYVNPGEFDIAYSAPNFWVAYVESGSLKRARLASASGAVVDTGVGLAPGCCQYGTSIGFDGDVFVVSYNEYVSTGYNVKATRIATDGTDLDATDVIVLGDGTGVSNGSAVASIADLSLFAYSHYDATSTSMRAATRLYSRSPDGSACKIGIDCVSGNCVDGVCCDTACGGTDPADCQACSLAEGAAKDGACTTLGGTHVCRSAAGVCDADETCTGTSTSCPADVLVVSGKECRASAGACDPAETCTGTSAACPGDVLSASSVVCRASAGACDPKETCTGTSVACPTDALTPTGTECRAAAGACDAAETCNGSSALCPGDLKKPSGTECRAAAGVCDVAETCDGASVSCPADVLAPSTSTCRASVGWCDVAENCTGKAAACPTDVVLTVGTECRPSVGACDVVEKCDGVSGGCPADVVLPNATLCRGAAGACDIAESCTGTLGTCPTDAKRASGATCRSASGVCDITETCDGTSDACPSDAFAPSTTLCRGVAGLCDIAENCTGTAGSCPTDAKLANGTGCRAANGVCDVAEACDGTNAACPADGFAPSSTVCRAANGACDAAESCIGTASACPADGFAPSSTVCRPAVGPCDAADRCTGTDSTCSSDAKLSSGTLCRAANGVCDVSESCDGTSDACPTDAYAGSSVSCRAASCASGTAILAQSCDGTGPGCPPVTNLVCAPYVCGTTTCQSTCTADSDCVTGNYCSSAGQCTVLGRPSDPCQSNTQCKSGYCVDGVCCDTACTGQCQACDVGTLVGTCSPVVSGAPHGARTACANDGSPCGGSCDGTNAQGCTYPDSTTQCRSADCSNDVATLPAACDGSGSCPAVQTQPCGAYSCSGTICGGDCTADANCGTGFYCSGGICTAKVADRGACGTDNQCQNGRCVDGYCCNSACTGQCEACDVPSFEGVCTAVTDAPHGGRAACAGFGMCAGTCDGKSRIACAFPDSSKQCSSLACSGGVQSYPATCDGAGTCQNALTQSCGAYTCGAVTCLTSCTVDAECASGRVCQSSECVAGTGGAGGGGAGGASGATSIGGQAGSGVGGSGASGAGTAGTTGASGGTAGASATGGTGGSGNAGTGGSVAQGGGSDLDAGADAGQAKAHVDSGCGCRLGDRRSSESTPLWIIAGLLLAARRRRRSHDARAGAN